MGLRTSATHTLYYGAGLTSSWQAYCDFTTAGGPWTLVAKVDPGQVEWGYDNARWTDASTLNETSLNLNRTSAKFRGFSELTFTSMRLDFSTNRNVTGGEDYATRTASFAFDSGANTLRGVFAGANNQAIAAVPRATWLGLIPTVGGVVDVQLQDFCNRVAFNARSDDASHDIRIRVGILGNNANSCSQPDSWIGVGGNPTDGVGGALTAGNRHPGITSFRRTQSWVFIWLR